MGSGGVKMFAGMVFILACVAAHAALAVAAAQPPAMGPEIHTEDVARFFRIHDAAGGHPGAEQLQRDYLDPASDGLHRLAQLRNITGARIADSLEKHPEIYSEARRCMTVLPQVHERLEKAFHRLVDLYPQAQLKPATIVVGRGKPVGVADETGVMIGLEALCAITYLNPDVEERFVHVIAHEYSHVQQAIGAPAFYNNEKPTVLEASLIEGAAEFAAELTSGKVGYGYFATSTKGREREIEEAFVADQDKKDLSNWLYNATLEKPGDLGYWVGYRIVKSYYGRAADKRRAFRDIIGMSDAKAFLRRSGWHPGMRLP